MNTCIRIRLFQCLIEIVFLEMLSLSKIVYFFIVKNSVYKPRYKLIIIYESHIILINKWNANKKLTLNINVFTELCI